MIKQTLGKLLAETINRVVALDPDARRKLRRLEGRSVGLDVRGPDLALSMTVQDGKVVIDKLDPEQLPEAVIRATTGALLAMFGSQGRAASGQIELSGDTETARRFSEFFNAVEPDFEEGMTRLFGDVLGVHLWRTLQGSAGFAKRASSRFTEDLSEYLREESQQLPQRSEVEAFMDSVDDLRDEVASLERRADRLFGKTQ